MNRPRVRLVVAGLLFLTWLGWLTYLAFNKTAPVVLSRSQLMVAEHFVLAEVSVVDGQVERKVTVVEDLRPVAGKAIPSEIAVFNLREARLAGASDFSKPGKYLLPLTKVSEGYILTLPASSPAGDVLVMPRPWAYYWEAPGVTEQFHRLVPPSTP